MGRELENQPLDSRTRLHLDSLHFIVHIVHIVIYSFLYFLNFGLHPVFLACGLSAVFWFIDEGENFKAVFMLKISPKTFRAGEANSSHFKDLSTFRDLKFSNLFSLFSILNFREEFNS